MGKTASSQSRPQLEPLEPRVLLSTTVTSPASVLPAGITPDAPILSLSANATGRYVAFESASSNLVDGDTNGLADIFVLDRHTDAIRRVSVATDGRQGDLPSINPSISDDGRWVAFDSLATTFSQADGSEFQAYLHDRQTGQTRQVSVSSAGTPADGRSIWSAVSPDGSAVAFASYSANLPGGDGQTGQLYVHRVATGQTVLVSDSPTGAPGNGDSGWYSPAVFSADGGSLAFASNADNLVADDTNGVGDVFLADVATGGITRVSLAHDASQANGDSRLPDLSDDGSQVSFVSDATNLVAGDTNGLADVFVRDLGRSTTLRASVSDTGGQADADLHLGSLWPSVPAMGPDGRYVAFATTAGLDPTDANGSADLYLRDLKDGQTCRVSRPSSGDESFLPVICSNGTELLMISGDVGGTGPADVYAAGFDSDDDQGPAVLSTAPDGEVVDVRISLVIRFDRPIDPASFTASDVTMTSANGAIDILAVQAFSDRVFRVDYGPAPDGPVVVTIGPNIRGANGNRMDQDGDGRLGEAGDDVFAFGFTLETPNVAPTVQLETPARYEQRPPGWPIRLGWEGDDDDFDDLVYDVYLSDLPVADLFALAPVAVGVETHQWSFAPDPETHYWWGVVARDTQGAQGQSAMGRFHVGSQLPALADGVPVQISAQKQQNRSYAFALAADGPLTVLLAPQQASTRTALRVQRIDTSDQPVHESRLESTTGERVVHLPQARAGLYRVTASSQSADDTLTLSAWTPTDEVVWSTPRQAGQGPVTIELVGDGLDQLSAVQLLGPGDQTAAVSVAEASASRWVGQVDLTDQPAGSWDLQATFSAAGSQRRAGAITVASTTTGAYAEFVLPEIARSGVPVRASVNYGNTGNIDAAPMLLVADLPENVFYRVDADDPWRTGTMVLLCLAGSDETGMLPPSAHRTVDVQLKSSSSFEGEVSIAYRTVQVGSQKLDSLELDWSEWVNTQWADASRRATWSPVADYLADHLGTGWDALASSMVDLAGQQNRPDREVFSLHELLAKPIFTALTESQRNRQELADRMYRRYGFDWNVVSADEPGRTFLIIVAQQDFDEGNSWNLDGVRTDADGMYQHYLEEIPPERILYSLDATDGPAGWDPEIDGDYTGDDFTKDSIRSDLMHFKDDVRPGDQVYIYMGGHGDWSEHSRKGYYYVRDADTVDQERYRHSELLADLGVYEQCQVNLLLDTCHSGSIFNEDPELWQGMNIISGCTAEVSVNDLASITRYLLKYLTLPESDTNGDGVVSWEEAYFACREEMKEESGWPGKPGAPDISIKDKYESAAEAVGLDEEQIEAFVDWAGDPYSWPNPQASFNNPLTMTVEDQIRKLLAFFLGSSGDELLDAGDLVLRGVEFRRSFDPNEKAGPAGYGPQGYIAGDAVYWPYEIAFENLPTASLSAQVVRVTDDIDADLDSTSFQFTSVTIGSQTINIPPGHTYYQTIIPSTLYEELAIGVTLQFDAATGRLTATLETLDGDTLQPTADPLAGFLPPNDGNDNGQGYIRYSIRPRVNLAPGTQVTNSATIIFDANDPIVTNTTFNTLARITTDRIGTGAEDRAVTFTDTDGDLVRVVLVGGGSAQLVRAVDNQGRGDLASVMLSDTTSRSRLIIASRGKTTLGHLSGSGSLGVLVAPHTDLLGSVTLGGELGVLLLDDVRGAGQQQITADSPARGTVAVLGHVSDLSMALGTIRVLRLRSWTDRDATADRLRAEQLTGLVCRGDFQADVSLTDDGSFSLHRGVVLGDVTGHWTLAGDAGIIFAAGTADGWQLSLEGSAHVVRLGQVTQAEISAPGTLRALIASNWRAGSVTAGAINNFLVTGDLSANVTLTDPVDVDRPGTMTLGRLIVRGLLSDCTVHSAGNIGRVIAGGMSGVDLLAGLSDGGWSVLPDSRDDFAADVRIHWVIVRGTANGPSTTDAFHDSRVAASRLTGALLPSTDAGSRACGMAVQSVQLIRCNTSQGIRLLRRPNTIQSLDDLLIRVL